MKPYYMEHVIILLGTEEFLMFKYKPGFALCTSPFLSNSWFLINLEIYLTENGLLKR